MSATLESSGWDRLSRSERLALVQALWDSIAADCPPILMTEAQRRELERRLDEDDATPDDVVQWERVKAQTQARFKQ